MKKSLVIVLLFTAGAAATLVLAQSQPRLSGGAAQTAASAKLKPGGVPPKGLTETQKRAVIQAANPAIAASAVVQAQPIHLTPKTGYIKDKAELAFTYPAYSGQASDSVDFDCESKAVTDSGAAVVFESVPRKNYLVTIGIYYHSPSAESLHFSLESNRGQQVTQTFTRRASERTGWSGNGVLSMVVPGNGAGGANEITVKTPKQDGAWTFFWAEIDPL